MFSRKNLYNKPLIQIRNKPNYDNLPSFLSFITSAKFLNNMNHNSIEKIVAMRSYAKQDIIAFKIKYYNTSHFVSVIMKHPELMILKIIWDCNHSGFNFAIKNYLLNSTNAKQQLRSEDKLYYNWYKEVSFDKYSQKN